MYSELLKKEKVESNLKGRVILGESEECSAERLKDMLLGFCTREDLVLVPQKRVHELFEDYCQKNGYPLFSRKAVGLMIHKVFGVKTKTIRVEDAVIGVYV